MKLQVATENFIGRTASFSQKHALLVVMISLIAAFFVARYVVTHIAINTDTEKMLSEKLTWRINYEKYKQAFPYFADTIVVVVDGQTEDLAEDAARTLANSLAQDTIHFESVLHPAEDPFFRENQFLYLSPDELERLGDELSQAQPLLAQLAPNPDAENLIQILNQAFQNLDEPPNESFERAIRLISMAVNEALAGNMVPLSWQGLIGNSDKNSSSSRSIFLVKPILNFAEILPAEQAIETIRARVQELELSAEKGITVRLTGGAALAHDEMSSVISGSQRAGTVALVMVLICLYFGLKSWALMIATLITLLVGLTLTAGFAVAGVGTLNMISIAFAVLYVGLGVDFAIHICLRYRELVTTIKTKSEAINLATRHVGASITLCAITTAVGFFAFIPTNFKGVAELGLISGTGMFISLVTTILLLPAILQLIPQPKGAKSAGDAQKSYVSFVITQAKPILIIAGCLWFVAAISVSFVSFDSNPINLNDQTAESVLLFHELANAENGNAYAASILADNKADMASIVDKLNRIASVRSVATLESLIPEEQELKLALIDDTALIIGDELSLGPKEPIQVRSFNRTLLELFDTLETPGPATQSPAAKQLQASIKTLIERGNSLAEKDQQRLLENLNSKLMESFSGRINRLTDGLHASGISAEDLPSSVRQRWLSSTGLYRIEAVPRENLTDSSALRSFVNDVMRVTGDRATGAAVINVSAAQAVQNAFIQALCSALLGISVILYLVLRSFKEVLITIFPLLLAGLLTTAVVVVTGLRFNFANVIALPLLLGIGVDSSLHLLHRFKTDLPANGNILETSTARAVLFSAATTAVSFGNLAISKHAGTASMGVILTIGIISSLFCMLIVLPAMLTMFVPKPVKPA